MASTYVLVASTSWTGHSGVAAVQFAQLTSAPGVEWFPSISADGKWIVYSGEQTGNRDIYLQRVGGEVPFNLTKDTPEDDDQPSFSPDGERIAFRSSRNGGGIFVMGRTGENVRRVTAKGFRPSWSPDGKEIAVTTENVELNPGNSEGVSELWIANVTTGAMRKLSQGQRRVRRCLGRFDDHRAPRRECRRNLARDHRRGKVPRRNGSAYPYRLLDHEQRGV